MYKDALSGKEIIKASKLSFNYSESKDGIADIDFVINEGDIVLLTGNSGCGKSTLLKCLNGLIPAITEGDLKGVLSIEGSDYSDIKIHELNKIVGSVFQNPRSQFFTENTTAELVFPMENYGYTKAEMDERLKELIEAFGIGELMDHDIYSLSSGERQLIALASSVTMHQKVLLFDEPSANLDYGNSMRLGSLISRLKKEGYTILVADHRFFYLNGRLDKVLFMEDGNLKAFDSEEAFKNSGYNVRSFDLFSIDIPFRPVPDSNECIAEMNNVSYKNILHDVSLKLYRNEVVGIVGNNGVGKTTLAKLICKTFKPDEGSIRIKDLPFFIMQDPDYQLFGTSVKNELSLVKDDDKKIEECLKELGLLPYKNKHPFDLSGGQKQRLQIGMAMLCEKDLIIFDEPTSGLDISSMKTIAGEILKLKTKAGILVISHDYEFLRNVADRIVFVSGGTIEKDFYLNEKTVSDLNDIFTKMQEEKAYEE